MIYIAGFIYHIRGPFQESRHGGCLEQSGDGSLVAARFATGRNGRSPGETLNPQNPRNSWLRLVDLKAPNSG